MFSGSERLDQLLHMLKREASYTAKFNVSVEAIMVRDMLQDPELMRMMPWHICRYENDDMMDTLKYFAAHPKTVDGPETARALPILLSTKLEVEMEQHQFSGWYLGQQSVETWGQD